MIIVAAVKPSMKLISMSFTDVATAAANFPAAGYRMRFAKGAIELFMNRDREEGPFGHWPVAARK